MSDLEIKRVLPAPVEKVYAMWVSTNTVLPPTEALEINATVGGIYKLIMPGDFCMTGHFSVVEPNNRLIYSWQWQGDDEVTEVEVLFAPASAQTHVQLLHRGFNTDDSKQRHLDGWHSYLDGFERLIAEARS